jgi:hypothetical protein
MMIQSVSKKDWAMPKLTVHGKVEQITQDTWKSPGGGDGVIICIDDNPVSVSTCPPGC